MNKIEIDHQITELYVSGMSERQVASKLNVNRNYVRKILARNNIPKRLGNYKDADLISAVCEMYTSGSTLKQIAEALPITCDTASRYLKKNNIPIRTQSDWTKSRYSVDESYFDDINKPNPAYFLGILYADGNSHPKHNEIRLTLNEDDIDILIKLKNDIKTDRPLYHQEKCNQTIRGRKCNIKSQYSLEIINPHITSKLYEYGVVPNKTFVISYPMFLTGSAHRHFIRGLLDGDGYIASKRGCAGICGTLALCNGIKSVVEKQLDIHVTVRRCGSIYKAETYGGRQCRKFLDWLYEDAELFLERKFEAYQRLYVNYVDGRTLRHKQVA